MSKYNLYRLIKEQDIRLLQEFVISNGESGLDRYLLVGKGNLPLIEAMNNYKIEAFNFILKNLSLEILFNSNHSDVYLTEIIKSIKYFKYYYDELLKKIKNEASWFSWYYRKIAIYLISIIKYELIEKAFVELLQDPLFNYQDAIYSHEKTKQILEIQSHTCFEQNLSKNKWNRLGTIFSRHKIYINSVISANIYYELQTNGNEMWKTFNSTYKEQRINIFKLLEKNTCILDIDKEDIQSDFLIENSKDYSFNHFLLFSGFFDLHYHYFRCNEVIKVIKLCKDTDLEWCRKYSIFYPFNCVWVQINEIEHYDDLPTNYSEIIENCQIILNSIKDYYYDSYSLNPIYTCINTEFKEFLLEIFLQFKTKYPMITNVQETIDLVNEIFD